MADFVDKKKSEMEARLTELRPMYDEYDRLEAAVAALSAVGPRPSRRGKTAKRAAKQPVRRKGTGARGRPKGSGVRDKQALELVTTTPGVTIPEMAQEMGIKQNYLYRVLPSLEKEGLVRKKGRGWYPR